MESSTWKCRQNRPGGPRAGHTLRICREGSGPTRPFAPLPPCQPGRHRAYHERIAGMIRDEEAKLVAYLGSVVYDLTRRLNDRPGRKVHDRTKASRDLILHWPEHALADELGVNLAEVSGDARHASGRMRSRSISQARACAAIVAARSVAGDFRAHGVRGRHGRRRAARENRPNARRPCWASTHRSVTPSASSSPRRSTAKVRPIKSKRRWPP